MGPKSAATKSQMASPLSPRASPETLYKTPRVETTSSLAMRPVRVATAAFQAMSPTQPMGAKTQAMERPRPDSREALLSSTAWSTPSWKP